MSLAKDDIGAVSKSDALKTQFIKSGTVDQKPDINNKEISDSQPKEPEIRDVYEKKVNTTDKRFDKIQEDYNTLKKQEQALGEVDSGLKNIEQTIENSQDLNFSEKLVNKNLEKIDKIIESINLTTKKPSEKEVNQEQTKVTDENIADDLELAQKKEDSLKKIQELKEKVREKQEQVTELEEKIRQEVNSNIQLNVSENADSLESEAYELDNLKQSIIKEIKENPEQSKKMHVKNLNSNLLLAMLSLRQ